MENQNQEEVWFGHKVDQIPYTQTFTISNIHCYEKYILNIKVCFHVADL